LTADRWAEIERVYHATLDRAAGDRAAFLDEACAGDEVLLREVRSLLAYEPASAEFLERPALEQAATELARDAGGSLTGKQIAGYEVLSLLGAGGMGEVYRAREVRLDREVALKVLPAEVASNANYIRRFEAEARSASGLSHPNIVTIYAVGEEGGTAYIAMELVEGRTLRELLADTPPTLKATLDLAVQLADALSAAHGRGIVHRDLKPENVMVTPQGLVKVLDFGIAKSERGRDFPAPAGSPLSTRPGATEAGTILGTVGYMSPEQAAGLPAGPTSDQFSFGRILYEMLAGGIPAEHPEVIQNLDPPLRAVLARSLAADPRERYPDTRELAIELRRIRETEERREERRGSTRRRAVWLGVATAVAAGAGFASWRFWPRGRGVRSLAVLPFANPLGDEKVEYLCDGIAESLTRGFSRLPSMSVKPRSAVANFREKRIDPREAGRRLAAEAVVSGTVALRSGRLHITAELVDVSTGIRLWSNSYDRSAGDALGAQNEIAKAIVDEGLHLKLTSEDRRQLRTPTKDPAAYQLYLQAIHLWEKETEADYLEARGLLRDALDRDPAFALAYAALATTYSVTAVDGYERPAEAWPEVSRYVRLAFNFDPDLPDAHAEAASALFYFQWDWAGAEQEWNIALRSRGGDLVPDFLYSRALQRWALGRPDEALALTKEARGLDPVSPAFILKEAAFLLHTKQLDRAASLYESVIGTNPGDPRAYFGLAEVRRVQERFDEAIDSIRRARDVADGPDPGEILSTARAEDGFRRIDRWLAQEELDALRSRMMEGSYTSPLDMARAFARLGDREKVFSYFDSAFQDRSAGLVFLNVDRAWDAVRDDPRFLAAVRRVGLPG